MHFFDRTLYLQICIWKQTFSLGKDERYRLTFDWRFSALSQSEIRVHWWTHNSKNPTNLGRREFNSTLHQSSHGFATSVHGFATKTKALTHEIPPATQAIAIPSGLFYLFACFLPWHGNNLCENNVSQYHRFPTSVWNNSLPLQCPPPPSRGRD